jgi:hypothetical protein
MLAGFCLKLLMVRNLIFWFEAPCSPVQFSSVLLGYKEEGMEGSTVLLLLFRKVYGIWYMVTK